MTKVTNSSEGNSLVSVLRAAGRAATWHSNARHKGVGREPYINHLIEVAQLVSEATRGSDAVLTIAALLHDAVEKADTPPSQIKNEFGDEVCDLVLEVTDDPSLSKEERRQHQIEMASRKSMRAKLLKLADLTSNLRALAQYDPTDRERENPLNYAVSAEKVASGLRGVNPWLEEQFGQALSAVLTKMGQLQGGREAVGRR